MSSEISLHRRVSVPGEPPDRDINADLSQNRRSEVEFTERDAEEHEEETPAPEVAPLQPRAFASDMSQIMDVGVCLQAICPGDCTHAVVSQEYDQLQPWL